MHCPACASWNSRRQPKPLPSNSARQAVQATLNGYLAGTVAYTSVITQQTTLLSDQQAALAIQQSRLVASVALIEALGGGWSTTALPAPESVRDANPVFP